jgi:hypothetical protein
VYGLLQRWGNIAPDTPGIPGFAKIDDIDFRQGALLDPPGQYQLMGLAGYGIVV